MTFINMATALTVHNCLIVKGSSWAMSIQTNTTPTALPTLMVPMATNIHQLASIIHMVQAIHTAQIAQQIPMARE